MKKANIFFGLGFSSVIIVIIILIIVSLAYLFVKVNHNTQIIEKSPLSSVGNGNLVLTMADGKTVTQEMTGTWEIPINMAQITGITYVLSEADKNYDIMRMNCYLHNNSDGPDRLLVIFNNDNTSSYAFWVRDSANVNVSSGSIVSSGYIGKTFGTDGPGVFSYHEMMIAYPSRKNDKILSCKYSLGVVWEQIWLYGNSWSSWAKKDPITSIKIFNETAGVTFTPGSKISVMFSQN